MALVEIASTFLNPIVVSNATSRTKENKNCAIFATSQVKAFFVLCILMVTCAPANVAMSFLISRRKSFRKKKWNSQWFDADELAEAGFYATGNEDEVICFHCNLGLKKWKASCDNAWEEHLKYSPDCQFVMVNELINGKAHLHQDRILTNNSNSTQLLEHLRELFQTDAFCKITKSAFSEEFASWIVTRAFLRHHLVYTSCEELLKACQQAEEEILFAKEFPSFPLITQVPPLQIRKLVDQTLDEIKEVEINIMITAPTPTFESKVSLPSLTDTTQNYNQIKLNDSDEASSSSSVNAALPMESKNQRHTTSSIYSPHCLLCKTNPLGISILPCGHVVLCRQCINKTSTCPVRQCNVPIQAFVKVFLC